LYVVSTSGITILNDKCVFTADGSMIGNILIILKGSFLVRSIKGTFVTYYDIPLGEIKQILGNCVTLHPFKIEILQKYMKSTENLGRIITRSFHRKNTRKQVLTRQIISTSANPWILVSKVLG
jgi:hypothetical protein